MSAGGGSALLPAEFADLEPFAAKWALPSEPERYGTRLASTTEEMQVFYDAITPRIEDVMAYLEKLPYDALPDDATNLLYLLYSMIQASFPVEIWHQPKVPDTGATSFDCFVEPVP
jgi:hypothetical protein